MRGLLVLLLALGCREDAAAVADGFVEAYFVEISQEHALPYATGLARSKLMEELRLVADVRGRGYTPEQARSRVRFRRRDARLGKREGRVVYDIAVDAGGGATPGATAGATMERSVYVILRREDEGWRVSNWNVSEARTPR